jgi:hypothetical protein
LTVLSLSSWYMSSILICTGSLQNLVRLQYETKAFGPRTDTNCTVLDAVAEPRSSLTTRTAIISVNQTKEALMDQGGMGPRQEEGYYCLYSLEGE